MLVVGWQYTALKEWHPPLLGTVLSIRYAVRFFGYLVYSLFSSAQMTCVSLGEPMPALAQELTCTLQYPVRKQQMS